MSEKKKYKPAGRFFYWLYIGFIGRFFLKLKLKTVFDRTGLEDLIKNGGPALVLSSHISNLDFIFAGVELYPNIVTFVGSHHFTTNKITRHFLKVSAAIPKKMFCADVSTIISIMRALDAGQIIVLYPEGRLTCSGKSVKVTEGTVELVKKLGVDVYWLTQDGAYKSVPKWAGLNFRPGKVVVHGGKLFDKEDLKAMSKEEIGQAISRAIYHDEDKLLTDVEYKSKKIAEGLHGILYKCPVCGETFRMSSSGDILKCEACGTEWKLDNKYVLHGPVFDHINDWYDWEQETIDTSVPIDSEVTVATPGEDGLLVKDAGKGHFHVDRDNIIFKGEVFGKPLEFTESTKVITAFPASVRDHVSLYSGRVLYYFMPEPDRTAAVYWVQYLDK
ncbi:MAG: 1-acyl-sn-glycerol-3-phosphate acyltransferase, partial [Firmicutes bacterium]|nr:1-acyl-sn-glycerol-3-phosphate acyltransferase [Bacillota bacterium]